MKRLLVGRKQQVKISNTKKLRAEVVEAGVPQGVVLSATLVLIIIKDMLDLKFKCQISAFAEDVSFSTLGI